MVFGNPVLRSMVVVFDKTNNRAGMFTYPSIVSGYMISMVLMLVFLML
jgi:hypothetical protein